MKRIVKSVCMVALFVSVIGIVNADVTTEAWYDLNGSGAVTGPVTGTGANPVDLDVYGTPQYGAGTIDFDGTGDYLQGVVGALPTIATDNMGLEVMLKADSFGGWNFVANIGGGGGNPGGIGILQQNGVWNLLYNGSGFQGSSTTAAAIGEWVHIAAVIDNGIARLFIDGIEEATVAAGPAIAIDPANDYMTIAGNPWDVPAGVLDGEIDYVHVFTFEQGAFTPGDLVVPEPATMALLGLGGLAAIRRKR